MRRKLRRRISGVRMMIEVKGLTFSYHRNKETLHGLDFSVEDGEIFGFLGPNGSGKSTTQKILTGILGGYGGEVRLFHQKWEERMKEKIGVLFEFPYLYTNLSALDNLNYFASFYPKERHRDVEELLDMLEFKKDYLKKPVSSYSKGMRQRVSMARALLNNPELLFLDEPTSGLDPSGAVLFRKIIEEERKKGTTVFLTTHNMLDADLLCDRIAFIADGEIKAIDTPERLKQENSSRCVQITYRYQEKPGEALINMEELNGRLPFLYDEIMSIHSKEPTLEDIFIQYTGRGLA